MKKIAIALVLASTGFATTTVMAQETPWLVRARAVDVIPANSSDPITALSLPSDAVSIAKKVIPEVDFTYFVTPNWSAELVLTYPQKMDVSVAPVGAIGSVKVLPPTLTAQYHFLPASDFNPYLGVGINYTNFSNIDLKAAGIPLNLNSSSWGYAAQAGVDYKLDKNWSLNLDVKYVEMRNAVYGAGQTLTHIQINPMLVGAGVGYRF